MAKNYEAKGVQIDVRDTDLFVKQWQTKLPNQTNSAAIIAEQAFALFDAVYPWKKPIRSITVRVINLTDENEPEQLDFYNEIDRVIKKEKIEDTVYQIRKRFGSNAILPARLYQNIKMPTDNHAEIRMPTGLLHF